jgi:HlyD family secretion protein
MKGVTKVFKWLFSGKRKYVLIGLLIAGMGYSVNQATPGVAVQGTRVDVGPVQRYVEEVGAFESKTTLSLKGRLSSHVETLYKVEGDSVKAGELVIELDKKDQLLVIQATEAEIDALYAQLAEAGRADINKVAQVKSKITQAQNTYIESKEDYENNLVLFESGAISKSDVEDSKLIYQNDLESLKIAKNDLTLLTKGVSDNVKRQYESQVQALIAQLELEKRQLEQMSIKAPMDGIVTDKFIEVGDTVSFGSALLEISDPEAVHITSDLLVSDAGNTQVGYKVKITDPESNQQWLGRIAKIYPKAFNKVSDLGIEQKRIKVEIDPENMVFDKFGYEFDLKIIFEDKESVLRCKDSAVFKIDNKNYVFKVVSDRTVLVPVVLGLEGEEYVEILEGLSQGDALIQSPSNELEEGIKVILK